MFQNNKNIELLPMGFTMLMIKTADTPYAKCLKSL